VRAPDGALSLPSAGDVLAYWRALGPKRWFVTDAAWIPNSRSVPWLYAASTCGIARPRGGRCLRCARPHHRARPVSAQHVPRHRRCVSWADPLAAAAAGRADRSRFRPQAAKAERRSSISLHALGALADQECCLELVPCRRGWGTLKYAELHLDIIRRFGRFPHRNAVLGRVTTPEEQSFLDEAGLRG